MSGESVATFQIINELGLHARAAAKLVQVASQFDSDVQIEKDGQRVDAKSVMGVLLLGGQKGTEVTLRAQGADSDEALAAIGELFANRFGEAR